jgi:outer membrane protein OmpA-like peptidoglycan-associated protein
MRSRWSLSARHFLAALAVSGALAGGWLPAAWAQATLNPRALDQLPPPAGAATATPEAPAKPPLTNPVTKPIIKKPIVTRPGSPASPPMQPPAKLPAVIVPLAPPPPPVLPAPFVVPTRPPPPPTPTPITADAPGGVIFRNRDTLRITFGLDRADLNPATAAAIADLVQEFTTPDTTYTVSAFATGGDDPSLPRRMSLSRALSVRSALMQAGVASVRIYVKALGAASPLIADGPRDRVDIVVTPGQMPAPLPAAAAVPPATMPATPPSTTTTTTSAPPPPAPLQKAAP